MSKKEEERTESAGTAGGSGEDIDVNDVTTPKICVVCNDRALSCNFGAITCESCKAFFRRNAAKNWTSKCEGKCPVTVETRSYCKKCRLAKCFEVGMNKSLILTDEQKRLRKQKILENKVRRGNVGGYDTGLPDMCLVTQDIQGMGLPHMGGLPHTTSLPVRCLPTHPAQGLNSIHPAFPYPSEKPGFERSTVNSTASQTSLPHQISDEGILLPTVEGQHLGTIGERLLPMDNHATSNKVKENTRPDSTMDIVRPGSGGISEVSSHMVSTTLGGYKEPYEDVISEGQQKNAFFIKEYSPDSKKHRTSSSGLSPESLEPQQSPSMSSEGSSQSDSTSESVLQQTGIVCTTLKILMDSESYKSGLQNLIAPIVVPNYQEIFNHPSLSPGDAEFLRHIRQLERAMSCAFAEAKQHNKCPKDPNYTQIFNFSETSIKCLVKMAKNLEPFLKLDTDDQILLLKNSILEMMVLGSAASYDPQEKGWHVRDGTEIRLVSTKAVKSSRDGLVLMCHYEMIILCVLSATKRDLGLLSLLTVLSLFSTKTQRVPLELHNKSKIDMGYQVYWNLMQKYVCLKYNSEVEVMVQNLGKASDIVRDFSETYIQSILKLPFDKINPLLLEIFDLPYT